MVRRQQAWKGLGGKSVKMKDQVHDFEVGMQLLCFRKHKPSVRLGASLGFLGKVVMYL